MQVTGNKSVLLPTVHLGFVYNYATFLKRSKITHQPACSLVMFCDLFVSRLLR